VIDIALFTHLQGPMHGVANKIQASSMLELALQAVEAAKAKD